MVQSFEQLVDGTTAAVARGKFSSALLGPEVGAYSVECSRWLALTCLAVAKADATTNKKNITRGT